MKILLALLLLAVGTLLYPKEKQPNAQPWPPASLTVSTGTSTFTAPFEIKDPEIITDKSHD